MKKKSTLIKIKVFRISLYMLAGILELLKRISPEV